MEEKDMVMSDEELEELLGEDFRTAYSEHVEEYRSIAQTQDQISFKAGYEKGQTDVWNQVGDTSSWIFDAGKLAGIMEVVDFIKAEKKCRYVNDVLYYPVYEKALEAKLKDWGIKEGK